MSSTKFGRWASGVAMEFVLATSPHTVMTAITEPRSPALVAALTAPNHTQ